MDEIPVEILDKIFCYFDLLELTEMRLVCKKFKFIVDQLRFKELIIIGDKYLEWDDNYVKYYYYESISDQRLFQPLNMCLVQTSLTRTIFKNLDYLNISHDINWHQFSIDWLNQLVHLKQLDFNSDILIHKRTKLNLPILKILYLNNINRRQPIDDLVIEFDTPNLEILHCALLNEFVHFVHEHTIKNLQINFTNKDLSKFTNLQIFQDNFASYVNKNILSILPASLKEIHLFTRPKSCNNETARDKMISLIEQKLISKRINLKIYFMGVQLIDNKPFDEYNFKLGIFDPTFYLQYYDSLAENISYFKMINYNKLKKSSLTFHHSIPVNFCEKFNNIQHIIVDDNLDQNEFSIFLKNCKNLNHLTIGKTSLNQQFFDQLPSICSLSKLVLNRQNFEVNYEFIYRFKKLYEAEFETKELNSLKSIVNSFSHCKYLNCIIIKAKKCLLIKTRLQLEYTDLTQTLIKSKKKQFIIQKGFDGPSKLISILECSKVLYNILTDAKI